MLQALDKKDDETWNADSLFPHVRAVLLASIHSTTTALTATLQFVLRHPRVHSRLLQELKQTGDTGKQSPIEDLPKLPYLNAVINESLRLFPPIPLLGPRLSPGLELDGIYVAKGQEMLTSLYSLQRNPLYFPQPDSFIPERWFEADVDMQKAAFQPFSTGTRSCIGKHLAMQVLRLSIARILMECDGLCAARDEEWLERSRCYTVWEVPRCWVQLDRSQRADEQGLKH
jgi:cytochrome P450